MIPEQYVLSCNGVHVPKSDEFVGSVKTLYFINIIEMIVLPKIMVFSLQFPMNDRASVRGVDENMTQSVSLLSSKP